MRWDKIYFPPLDNSCSAKMDGRLSYCATVSSNEIKKMVAPFIVRAFKRVAFNAVEKGDLAILTNGLREVSGWSELRTKEATAVVLKAVPQLKELIAYFIVAVVDLLKSVNPRYSSDPFQGEEINVPNPQLFVHRVYEETSKKTLRFLRTIRVDNWDDWKSQFVGALPGLVNSGIDRVLDDVVPTIAVMSDVAKWFAGGKTQNQPTVIQPPEEIPDEVPVAEESAVDDPTIPPPTEDGGAEVEAPNPFRIAEESESESDDDEDNPFSQNTATKHAPPAKRPAAEITPPPTQKHPAPAEMSPENTLPPKRQRGVGGGDSADEGSESEDEDEESEEEKETVKNVKGQKIIKSSGYEIRF